GNMVFDSNIVSSFKRHKKKNIDFDLSDREHEMLVLVAEGLSNKEIAEKMYLSEGTIRNYISNMLEKLDLRDRSQLAIYFYKTVYEYEE
ncbi:MAG: response regulator transcription factor, partial [Clostridiales bacterium]|nr:response regulator transcription factor [Clostridiales bacterium]